MKKTLKVLNLHLKANRVLRHAEINRLGDTVKMATPKQMLIQDTIMEQEIRTRMTGTDRPAEGGLPTKIVDLGVHHSPVILHRRGMHPNWSN